MVADRWRTAGQSVRKLPEYSEATKLSRSNILIFFSAYVSFYSFMKQILISIKVLIVTMAKAFNS
ncbi:hypothetical protein BpHYR1_032400 [Brachionus plicatilis]|uniref:Uncharacterized protein n=1 Tax=Brachionus plicatilis TaxID=10195 RepID=A0A3M7R2M3_BRAPC|nr:hypothetical protein BpHYR1_032400 [Brachionus plicatilis]